MSVIVKHPVWKRHVCLRNENKFVVRQSQADVVLFFHNRNDLFVRFYFICCVYGWNNEHFFDDDNIFVLQGPFGWCENILIIMTHIRLWERWATERERERKKFAVFVHNIISQFGNLGTVNPFFRLLKVDSPTA